MSEFPFEEEHILKNYFLREFKESVNEQELIWHQDKEDRFITVIEANNWYLQLDNELPFVLENKKQYYIPAYVFHRVIKGDGRLRIILEKWDQEERSKRRKKCANPKGFTMKQFCKNQSTRSKKGEKKN